jgi:hypothetical protein
VICGRRRRRIFFIVGGGGGGMKRAVLRGLEMSAVRGVRGCWVLVWVLVMGARRLRVRVVERFILVVVSGARIGLIATSQSLDFQR